MEMISSAILLLLWTSNFPRYISCSNVTYEELEALDAVCYNLDNCKSQKPPDTLLKYTCNCGSFCSDLDTCCIDSPHRDVPANGPTRSCKTVYGRDSSSYFMVDSCPLDVNDEDIWGQLCRDGNGENDLMSLVPVSSVSTNVTYKNYFCFRCHEEENAFLYWNVNLLSYGILNVTESYRNIEVSYSESDHSWMTPIGEGNTSVPVSLNMEIPSDIRDLAKPCILNVISNCSQSWLDDAVREKCGAYTSIMYIPKEGWDITYKNPHCALCNFENLENMQCSSHTYMRTSKRPFSFSLLLDINRSDGDRVGEIEPCDESSLWDPFVDRCRRLTCALPGHVVRNRKCSPL